MEFILTGIAKEIKFGKLVLVLDQESIEKQKNITHEYKTQLLLVYNKFIGLKFKKAALIEEFIGNFVKVRVKKENYFMRSDVYNNSGLNYRYRLLEIYIT